MKRYDPLYTLTVEVHRSGTRPASTASLARPVTSWMDWDGFLVTADIVGEVAALLSKVGVTSDAAPPVAKAGGRKR